MSGLTEGPKQFKLGDRFRRHGLPIGSARVSGWRTAQDQTDSGYETTLEIDFRSGDDTVTVVITNGVAAITLLEAVHGFLASKSDLRLLEERAGLIGPSPSRQDVWETERSGGEAR